MIHSGGEAGAGCRNEPLHCGNRKAKGACSSATQSERIAPVSGCAATNRKDIENATQEFQDEAGTARSAGAG